MRPSRPIARAAGSVAGNADGNGPRAIEATPDHDLDRPERLAGRTLRRLIALCIATTALTIGIYWLTVGTQLGQLMGELILGGRFGSLEAVRGAEEMLGALSRTALAAGGVVVISLALLQRREGLAVVAALTLLGSNVTTQLLKSVVLDRIDMLDRLFYALPNSFPSGHVTAAASVAVTLVLVLPPLLRSPTVILASAAVVVVAASTMLAGWHRMADAIGGIFVSTAWAAGLSAVLVWRRGVTPVGRRTAAAGWFSARILGAAGVLLLLLGTAAYLLALIDPLNVLILLAERGGSPALLAVGLLITSGASFLAFGGLGMAVREVALDPLANARQLDHRVDSSRTTRDTGPKTGQRTEGSTGVE